MRDLKSILLVSTMMAAGVASPAFAQVAAAEQAPSDDLMEIIVTAEKRAERLQDVPKSVDVVTGDTVDKLNLREFSDIQQLAPGLSLDSKEPNTNSITVRGVGFDPNSGTQPTVNVYFNETPLDTNSAFRSLYDIGQIEVLRGPQGTLRGRTSPSGAITIASRQPDLDKVSGYVQQTFTTQDGINTQAAVGAPIVDGKLAFRIAGLFDRNDAADAHNIRNGSDDGDKTRSVRASLAFKPTEDLTFVLTHQFMDNYTVANPIAFSVGGSTATPYLTPGDRVSLTNGPTEYHYTGNVTTLTGELDLGGVAINYVGGYQQISNDRVSDLARGGSIPNYSQMQYVNTNIHQVSQELRLTSQGRDFWNYLVGVYYDNVNSPTSVNQAQILPFALSPTPMPPLSFGVFNVGIDAPASIQDYAIFTDHRFKITDSDLIEVGGRYQEQHFDHAFNQTLSGPIFGPNPITQAGIAPDMQKGISGQFTGSASYKHDFSRDLTAYFSYGRSYRPGGVIATTAALDQSLLLYKPEKSDSYEIGLKGALLDRKLRFTLSAYQQDFQNYQAYTGSYLSVSTARNGIPDNNAAFTFNADAQVRGFEATLAGQITEHLQFGVSGTYNSTQFKNALAPCNDYNGDGVADSVGTPSVPMGQQVAFCHLNGRLSDQADWSLSANFEYDVPLWGNNEGFVRGLVNYIPKRTDPFQNISYSDLINNSLFLGLRDKDGAYEVSVFAKNLADVSTLTTRGAAQVDYSYYASGYAIGTPVRPREFGLNLRYAFGQ
ncbi:TonB-dependent receptor [Nitrospirillum bahiense]|uniref:Iron complex outermembrane receptor protein n=1 Tax=Nitrospirillum amazonense TaxID=28077 RepID=A0A560FVN2_9PROT|nr:TonB-dependent receptor [Nitrospirillum amazonense]TWB25703.1 iron complex outermembrane receptor protein [Nitrospirillum amazonense]